MVPRLHHKRSLHAHGHTSMETVSSSVDHPTCTEHDSHNSASVFHTGHLSTHDIPEDQQLACRIHCRITRPELGPHDLLRRETGSIQGRAVPCDVRRQSGIQLAVHGGELQILWLFSAIADKITVRHLYCRAKDLGWTESRLRQGRQKDNTRASRRRRRSVR